MGIPDQAPWQTQLIRLTAFPLYNDRAKEEVWWERILGAPADARTVKSRENLFQDEGEFESGHLALSIRPGRVDWIWTVDALADLGAAGIPTLGSFPQALRLFRSKLDAWLDIAPPIVRLAFGVILDQSAQDKKSTYELLQEYLPAVKLSPDNSGDFLYQINRPRKSQVLPGYTINRLSKWMGMRGVISNANEKGLLNMKELSVARLEIDVNSNLEGNEPIDPVKIRPLLVELVSLTEEIVRIGDKF
jgi:hypothetical protein